MVLTKKVSALYIVIARHNKENIMARIYKKNNSYYFSFEAGGRRVQRR